MYLESKTKSFCHSLSRKKVRISIGNIDLFADSIFKNIEILSDQKCCLNQTKLGMEYPCLSRV